MSETKLSKLLRRDRSVIILGIALILALSWGYIIWLTAEMDASASEMVMPSAATWSLSYGLMIFVMWVVMMAAMMTPSAAPMIITYAKMSRRHFVKDDPVGPAGLFALAYLAVWSVFSLAATLAQWGLHEMSYLSPIMSTTDKYIGGAIIIAAGVFQWTPLKRACLNRCRAPIGFFMTEWLDGARGAFIMGIKHGAYCVGCCWVLMAVLFVTGVMNLLWVAVLAVFVLVEKVAPYGERIGIASGVALAAAGVWMMVA